MEVRWFQAAMAAMLLVLGSQAEAQRSSRPVAPPPLSASAAADRADADSRLFAAAAEAVRSRMIGVMPIADNIEFGIGRYTVGEIARPRTHMEADRHPTDVRRRGRGIAGVGLKLSF